MVRLMEATIRCAVATADKHEQLRFWTDYLKHIFTAKDPKRIVWLSKMISI